MRNYGYLCAMKLRMILMALALVLCGTMRAQGQPDTTAVLVQDSAYIAMQTAEIERLLAEEYARQMLDSLTVSKAPTPRFSVRQAIFPVGLLAVGTVAVWEHNMVKARKYVLKHVEASHTNADAYLQWVPMAMNVGLSLCGVKSKYSRTDDLLASVTSIAVMYGAGAAMKWAVGEERPHQPDKHNSFPSGHTMRAFRSAEMIRLRYGNWWGAGGYAIATTVAYLRLRNGKHWVNDVVGGAGMGILSARVGYWLVPFEKKLLGLDRNRNSRTAVAAVPYYDSANRGVGAVVAVQF